MNIVDIAILVILGVSVIYGLYRGFLRTILSLACCLISVFVAFSFSPKLAAYVSGNQGISDTLATYTDAIVRVGDHDLANTAVNQLSGTTIEQILDNAALPTAISDILKNNLNHQVFSSLGLNTVNDYVSQTVVAVAVNILCFIVCFALCYLVLSLLMNLIHHVFKMPILKQFDWLVGGIFGLIRGAMTLYVIFLVLPLISTVIPLDAFNQILSESTLAPIFQSDGFFASVISGKL